MPTQFRGGVSVPNNAFDALGLYFYTKYKPYGGYDNEKPIGILYFSGATTYTQINKGCQSAPVISAPHKFVYLSDQGYHDNLYVFNGLFYPLLSYSTITYGIIRENSQNASILFIDRYNVSNFFNDANNEVLIYPNDLLKFSAFIGKYKDRLISI